MKTKMLILFAVSAASLSGCMVYPGHGHGGYRTETGPTYIYGDRAGRRDESDHRGEHRHRAEGEREREREHGNRESGDSRR